jgi:hypothetical protein
MMGGRTIPDEGSRTVNLTIGRAVVKYVIGLVQPLVVMKYPSDR